MGISKRRISILVTFWALGALVLGACGGDSSSSNTPPVTAPAANAYFIGALDGPLATALAHTFSLVAWQDQTDKMVMLSSGNLRTLDTTQQQGLQTVYKNGHAIVVTTAHQADINALNQLLGLSSTVNVPPNGTFDHFDFYAIIDDSFGLRAYTMVPVNGLPSDDTLGDQLARAKLLLDWAQTGPASLAHRTTASHADDSSEPQPIQDLISAANYQQTKPITYYWATCGTNAISCQNVYTVNTSNYAVHSTVPDSQLTDYFIVQMSATMNTAGCWGFYGTRNHQNRINAYWARQYNFAATADNGQLSSDEFAIDPANYNPQSANPSTQVQTGVDWSLAGSGTVSSGSNGNSAGFSAGVNFINQKTNSYPALVTLVDINSTPQTANVAGWTYDSWSWVSQNIEPSNRACGGKGLLQPTDFPPIISTSAFSPVETWVWEAEPAVRDQLTAPDGTASLPVTVDWSVLLGWTYYPKFGFSECKPSSSAIEGEYQLDPDPGTVTFIVGSGPTQGITFDVSCDTTTQEGTIPLGTGGEDTDHGSPGTPLGLDELSYAIPFAPLTAPAP